MVNGFEMSDTAYAALTKHIEKQITKQFQNGVYTPIKGETITTRRPKRLDSD